jgi:hypothetical protein
MENGTLQDWKLYRQFRKTLDSLTIQDQVNPDNPENWLSHHDRFSDMLEITSIEDEGEQFGGTGEHLYKNKNSELEKLERKFVLQTTFAQVCVFIKSNQIKSNQIKSNQIGPKHPFISVIFEVGTDLVS